MESPPPKAIAPNVPSRPIAGEHTPDAFQRRAGVARASTLSADLPALRRYSVFTVTLCERVRLQAFACTVN